jgi:hypothetical protein
LHKKDREPERNGQHDSSVPTTARNVTAPTATEQTSKASCASRTRGRCDFRVGCTELVTVCHRYGSGKFRATPLGGWIAVRAAGAKQRLGTEQRRTTECPSQRRSRCRYLRLALVRIRPHRVSSTGRVAAAS